ncbi:thioesterase II family protein [Micromonospora echinofusca]|uniref:thioesterase II family protein n=1 Tax=Micromonospora echinofusca TaxID=47858 RepID=UPI0037234F4C
MDHLRLSGGDSAAIELPSSRWLRPCTATGPTGPLRAMLVLLPHAGGAAHTYSAWGPALPEGVTALAVEYPGHGTRMSEPPSADLGSVVTELSDLLVAVQDALDGRPLILGGHSLGALLAHEIAGEFQNRGRPVPELFLSAAAPPHRRAGLPDISRWDDDALAAALGDIGDLPREILADAEARALYLPMIRHDFVLARRYGPDARTAATVVRTRAVIVGGAEDGRCPTADLAAWTDLIDGPTQVTVLPGGHFYYRDQLGAVGRLIDGLVTAPRPATPLKEGPE